MCCQLSKFVDLNHCCNFSMCSPKKENKNFVIMLRWIAMAGGSCRSTQSCSHWLSFHLVAPKEVILWFIGWTSMWLANPWQNWNLSRRDQFLLVKFQQKLLELPYSWITWKHQTLVLCFVKVSYKIGCAFQGKFSTPTNFLCSLLLVIRMPQATIFERRIWGEDFILCWVGNLEVAREICTLNCCKQSFHSSCLVLCL